MRKRLLPTRLAGEVTPRTDPHVILEVGQCWWCGEEADSREHIYKRSDLVREWGKTPADRHGTFRAGDDPPVPLRGANASVVKFEASLCKPCNNAKSQPFDRAYDRYAAWLSAHEEELLSRRQIDFQDVFGTTWPGDVANLGRYFVKHVGCMAASSLSGGQVSLGLDVLDYLNGSDRWPESLTAELYIDTSVLMRVDAQELVNGSRSMLWTSRVDTAGRAPNGEIVAPQSRLGWRAIGFAWILNSEVVRPAPFGRRVMELPCIASHTTEEVASLRAFVLERGAGGVADRRQRQGLL